MEGLEFRVWGFRVDGLGMFRVEGFELTASTRARFTSQVEAQESSCNLQPVRNLQQRA